MMVYRVLIVLMYLLLLAGAGWLLRRKERDHQKELAALRREIRLLQGKLRLLTAPAEPMQPVRGQGAAEDQFLAQVQTLVAEDIDKDGISVAGIAAQMNMSEQTFRRRLQSASGTTPKEYLLSIQMERAARMLLLELDLPVQEVGRRCGFDDASNFGHSFKRIYHCSPSQYRDGRPDG